jgi:RNA polymerase sigma-70 factor (ECF subfamily)
MRAIEMTDTALDFDEFFRSTHRRALAAMYLVTGNRHEAEEIVQDAFVRVFERWDRIQGLDDPEGYLLRTAMNVFRDRFRRAVLAARRTITTPMGADDLRAVEDRDELVRMLRPLAPRQRAALVATSILDMSAEEAGRLLGMKASSIRSLASRARTSLYDLPKEQTR